MPWPGNAYTVFGAVSRAVADITSSGPTRAATSKTSAPWSIPTRSTRMSISAPGSTMPRNRAVQPISRAGGRACPSVAVATCCAAADSHMPCTMGDFSPASSAAARSVWIGLWSPDTTANGRMSVGAVMVTSRRRRRGVSVALSETAPPARTGSASSAAPVRPRIAKRSWRVASTVAVGCGDGDRDRDDPPELAVGGLRSRCGDGQFGRLGRQRGQHDARHGRGAPGSAGPPPPGSRYR